VIDAIHHWYFTQIKRIHTFKAPEIIPKLMRIGTPPVMRVDPAFTAKIMFRDTCAELITPETIRALNDTKPILRNAAGNRTAPPTKGTIAASCIHHTVGQIQFQRHRTAMACETMNLTNLSRADFCDTHRSCSLIAGEQNTKLTRDTKRDTTYAHTPSQATKTSRPYTLRINPVTMLELYQ
jgi:hypothetical protein